MAQVENVIQETWWRLDDDWSGDKGGELAMMLRLDQSRGKRN